MKNAIAILALSAPCLAWAQDTTDVAQRIFQFENPLIEPVSLSFDNPALTQHMHDVSLSGIFANICDRREDKALNQALGSGETRWSAGADAYIKNKQAALWGHAAYKHDRKRGIKWNETADPEIIYPYFTADSIGGRLDCETYEIGGGYASSAAGWDFGAELSYAASDEYRNVDPRPKNITGLLSISAGACRLVANGELAGISFRFQKYKQTSDMLFVSEKGKSEIYQLTGLGNCYNRFSGASETSHFSGAEWAICINAFPSGRKGLAASVEASRFNINKTLVDINKLPLCRIWQNRLHAQAGWIASRWSLTANFEASRRHGIENIFGDAASSVYPVIGSLEMYAENKLSAYALAACELPIGNASRLSATARCGYAHRCEQYAFPVSEILVDDCNASLKLGWRAIAKRLWNVGASVNGTVFAPIKTRLEINSESHIDTDTQRFYYMEKASAQISATAYACRALSRNYALGAGASFSQGFYRQGNHPKTISAYIRLEF